ncbi:MAG: Flagellar FliJ protein [Firmicutes bacterium ADurb.Bin354]|nr:MAG: Flagellar FliJ protein [Firmicutes bacterium ADurb.Bin354]
MARFNYRMQNILGLMENFEEQAKQNFADKRRILSEEEDALAALNDKKAKLNEEAKKLRLGAIDVRKIKENDYEKKFIDEEIKKQKVKVHVANKNLENARLRMQEAIKNRKMHEKLKENAFEQFMAEEAAKEIREIDGLTSYVYGAGRKNS